MPAIHRSLVFDIDGCGIWKFRRIVSRFIPQSSIFRVIYRERFEFRNFSIWRSFFLPRLLYVFLLSHAILVGNLLRRNSLRIRKSTLYFLLTCLERAHSCLNTRASRTAISTPSTSSNTFFASPSYLPCNTVSRIRWIYCLMYLFFGTYFWKYTLLGNSCADYCVEIYL